MGRWHTIAILIILTALFSSQTSHAKPLSLEESLKLARERNPVLLTSQWDRKIARENLRQADASLYPRVDLQGGYTAQVEPQAMKINGQTMETQQGRYPFVNLAATQTIYDFGRRDARRRQASTSLASVDFGVQAQEQDVTLQVIEAYFSALEGEKLLAAANEELNSVTDHNRTAQELHKNGMVTRNDLLQAEVRMASARQKALAARNRVDNLHLRLNFLIGAPDNDRNELSEPSITTEHHEIEDDPQIALRNRPDLTALRNQIETREEEVRESKSAFYPELFARFSLDYVENEKVREQAIYAASIGLKINLFDGFASTASRDKAINNRSRTIQQLRHAEQQAWLEINSSKNDLRVASERIKVTKEAIGQGEENLRINNIRYQERVGTATEVLDAQSLLTLVKTEHYQAMYDYQVARARLKKALGTL